MTKLQLTVVLSSVLLLLGLYFGCETKPKQQKLLEKSRALVSESTDISILLEEAKQTMRPAQIAPVEMQEQLIAQATDDSLRIEANKRLSGLWYELDQPAIAGYYAQQVAELSNSDESWSIAGTTYIICLQKASADKVRSFCAGRAVQAFENAISLAPDNIAHRINLALCYVENPPPGQPPMQGINMLRELNVKYPDNVLVLNQLARLAIRTGQYDKAIERLEKALKAEPDNPNANCLMAQALEGTGQTQKASAFAAKCPN
jgi:tetratricopeptide (TPR) repeat protein